MGNSNKPVVSVLDADFIPFYTNFTKKGEEDKTLEQCIDKCDDFINNINRYTRADYYVGYLTKGKCFRYNINSSYKANRKYNNMPKYLQEVRQHLQDKHNFLYQEGYESDDLVYSFKTQNKDKYDCIIVSPDKDILNLPGKHLNPRKMAFHRTSEDEATEFFWKSMVVGDNIDSIKGIPKCGEKYFESILEDMKLYEEAISLRTEIFNRYTNNFGEYEGIKEFTKNYLSLKLVNDVKLEDIKLNEVNKMIYSEQETKDRGKEEEPQ